MKKLDKDNVFNMSHKDLLELYYKQVATNERMNQCILIQRNILDQFKPLTEPSKYGAMISKILNSIKLNKILQDKEVQSHFHTNRIEMENKTELEVIEALKYINDYENNQVGPTTYLAYVARFTGIKTCTTCGITGKRIHNDFQRGVFALVKSKFSYLSRPIKLVSSKYSSSYYLANIPYYSYLSMVNLIRNIEAELRNFRRRGIQQAVDELELDLKTLNAYVTNRKSSTLINVFKGVSKSVETLPSTDTSQTPDIAAMEVESNIIEASGKIIKEIKESELTIKEELYFNDTLTLSELYKLLSSETLAHAHPKSLSFKYGLKYKGMAKNIRVYNKKGITNKLEKDI